MSSTSSPRATLGPKIQRLSVELTHTLEARHDFRVPFTTLKIEGEARAADQEIVLGRVGLATPCWLVSGEQIIQDAWLGGDLTDRGVEALAWEPTFALSPGGAYLGQVDVRARYIGEELEVGLLDKCVYSVGVGQGEVTTRERRLLDVSRRVGEHVEEVVHLLCSGWVPCQDTLDELARRGASHARRIDLDELDELDEEGLEDPRYHKSMLPTWFLLELGSGTGTAQSVGLEELEHVEIEYFSVGGARQTWCVVLNDVTGVVAAWHTDLEVTGPQDAWALVRAWVMGARVWRRSCELRRAQAQLRVPTWSGALKTQYKMLALAQHASFLIALETYAKYWPELHASAVAPSFLLDFLMFNETQRFYPHASARAVMESILSIGSVTHALTSSEDVDAEMFSRAMRDVMEIQRQFG